VNVLEVLICHLDQRLEVKINSSINRSLHFNQNGDLLLVVLITDSTGDTEVILDN
jgi:hypothetical protein